MKTSRERILNARIDSIVGSTDYRVPEGYYLKKLIVSSDSAGDTITVTLDGVLLCTVTATTALSQYEALINYDSLNKGSFLLNIAPRTGTGTAYIEISNEKPVVRSIGDFVHYPLTADQYAAISGASSPSEDNVFATVGDLIETQTASFVSTNITELTVDSPSTPDSEITSPTQTSPFGFSSADEMLTVLGVVKALHVDVATIIGKLIASGIIDEPAT